MMTTPTIPHVKLPTTVNELPEQRIGHWIVAGTPGSEPYPCTCRYMPCRYEKCQDRYRTDGLALPEGCCGRGNAPVADPGFVKPPRQPESAVDTPAHPDVPADPPSPASGGLVPPRESFSCDCETPWDPPAPVLLIAVDRKGPICGSVALAPKVADVRGEADKALIVLGRRRMVEWKDGRHVLLPPQPGARGKTRPCWHAKLDDGSLAVLDTPDETGSGIHCECHRNFSDAGAYQVHRRSWLVPCRDPESIFAIESSHIGPKTRLMKRTIGGVWTIDKTVTWSREARQL